MRREKPNFSPQIYEAHKALTVLIVQSPQTINLFLQIKLPRTWNRFCILSIGWPSSSSLLHHKIKIAAPSRRETRTAHTDTHKKNTKTEQHWSSMYGGLHFPTSPSTLGHLSTVASSVPFAAGSPSKSVDAQIQVYKAEKDLIAL